jgi:hypothetical protein
LDAAVVGIGVHLIGVAVLDSDQTSGTLKKNMDQTEYERVVVR